MSAQEKELKPCGAYAWVVLVGISLMTSTGICTVLANCSLFIPSILMERGYAVSEFTLWITCYQFGCAAAMLYAGNLWQKIPTQILLPTCIIVSMVCFALFGFVTELWMYWVLGAIIGLVGGVYFLVCAPFIIPNWFAKRTGFALGLGGLLASIETAILTPIQSGIIAAVGWHWGYVGCAAVSLVLSLPFALFIIRFKPSDKGMLPYGYDPNDAKSLEVAASGTDDAPGVPLGKAVKSLAFVLLFLTAGVCAVLSGFQNLWNNIGLSWGYDESFGTAMVTAAALFGVMNPVMGWLIDKIKANRATMVIFVIILLSCFLLIFCYTIPALALVGVFFFCCQGCITVSLVPFTALQIFGPKAYTKLCSYLQIAVSIIGAFSAPIIGLFFDMTGSYDGAFLMAIGICVLGLICILLCSTQIKSMKAKWEGEDAIAAAAAAGEKAEA